MLLPFFNPSFLSSFFLQIIADWEYNESISTTPSQLKSTVTVRIPHTLSARYTIIKSLIIIIIIIILFNIKKEPQRQHPHCTQTDSKNITKKQPKGTANILLFNQIYVAHIKYTNRYWNRLRKTSQCCTFWQNKVQLHYSFSDCIILFLCSSEWTPYMKQ